MSTQTLKTYLEIRSLEINVVKDRSNGLGWAQPMPDIQTDIWWTLKGEWYGETVRVWVCASTERVTIGHQQRTWTGGSWGKILPVGLQKEYGSANTLGVKLCPQKCERTKLCCFAILVCGNFNPISKKQIYRHTEPTGLKTVPGWCLRCSTWRLTERAVEFWLSYAVCVSLSLSPNRQLNRNSRELPKRLHHDFFSFFPRLLKT